jgi:YidC/Oxa1 family membrane protein insertase
MMDRTGWIGVVVCFLLMLVWMHYSEKRWPVRRTTTQQQKAAAAAQPAIPANPTLEAATNAPQIVSAQKLPDAVTAVLENEEMRVVFTTHGGAIQSVELKQHKQTGNENIVLNRDATEPVLNLLGWDGPAEVTSYDIQPLGGKVSFRRKLASGATLERVYSLKDNYRIVLEQTVSNPGAEPLTLPAYTMNIGTANPIHRHDTPTYTAASWMSHAGGAYHKNSVTDFDASTMPLVGYQFREARSLIASPEGPINWAAVQNQFFALILTPAKDNLISKVVMTRGKVTDADIKGAPLLQTIHARADFEGFTLKPEESRLQTYQLYAGPKEYARLQKLGRGEDLVMDFGWSGWLIKPLLSMMRGIHSVVPSWGWTIILMTLIIRAIMWPLQSVQNKSMKQMQALQPKIQTLREKYKDNIQKMNEEQIKLFREYGVNPATGCLPLLVQLPVFIAFYVMLQSVTELRGASFMWIADLTQPDTVGRIPVIGWDLNLLPLIMTATSVLMIRMTPQSAETQQMKFMQWLPLVFLFILYNFASALSLYMTVSNFVSIVQTYLNLRKPTPKLEKVPKKKQMIFGRV